MKFQISEARFHAARLRGRDLVRRGDVELLLAVQQDLTKHGERVSAIRQPFNTMLSTLESECNTLKYAKRY